MNVVLTEHLNGLVQRLVKNGKYNNQSEVVRDALRQLEKQSEHLPTCADLADALEKSELPSDERAAFAEDVAEYRKHANQRSSRC